MRIIRPICAAFVALTLAFAPVAAEATFAPQNVASSTSIDCDHHQHGDALPDKAPPADEHCLAMVNCGLCCATLTGVGVASLSHDAGMGAAIEPARLSGPSLSWLTAPPLRPPRA